MKLIYLDPGHGGKDPGAVNGRRHESDDVLKLSKAVKNLLEEQGFTVRMTRETDTYVSLEDRTEQANRAQADWFISIHRNSFANAEASGVEVWIYPTKDAETNRGAKEVLDEIVQAGVQKNRGVKKGDYHVCRETKMPAMLIEMGFITNATDNQLFDSRFEQYAKAIAKGICKAAGTEWNEKTASADQADTVYRVQVGAYSKKENADSMLKKIEAAGFDGFIASGK